MRPALNVQISFPTRHPVGMKCALSLLALLLVSGCVSTPEEKLRVAAMDGYAIRVERLLIDGVSPQAADERGVTPLHLAVKNGHREVIAILLDHGASMDHIRQDGVTPLFLAAQEGRRDIVALFLERGAEINQQARVGNGTLLHLGAYRGDQDMVALLLKYGADKNARMSSGELPVDLARQQGHTTLVPLLEP
jgi:ankyrin repeat protein